MNKLTKGAIAGAAGIVLLMGGAGSLAYWTGTANVNNGQSITAGTLNATAGTAGTWKLVTGATTTTDLTSTTRIVPGDKLTYTQDITVNATGDNLQFKVELANGAITSATGTANTKLLALLQKTTKTAVPTGTANVTAVSGQTDTYKVSTAGSTTFRVTLEVTWPNGAVADDNDAKTGAVTFGAYALNVTQVVS